MRSILFFSLLIFPLLAFSQVEDCEDESAKKLLKAVQKSAETQTCPEQKKIKNICMAISERIRDKDPNSRYKYLYQRKVAEAACVDYSKDDPATANRKIQQMWKAFENQLVCDSIQFDVPRGSIVKYAINQYFDDFLDDVVAWKVNLDKVDSYDGGTVLDYLKAKIERNKENQTSVILKAYYDRLRKAGAKHKSEL